MGNQNDQIKPENMPFDGNLMNDPFLKMMDHSPKGFFVVKIELNEADVPCDWTYVYCNDEAARLAHKTGKQLTGSSLLGDLSEGTSKWLVFYDRAAYQNEEFDFEEFSEEAGESLHLRVIPADSPDTASVLWKMPGKISWRP